MHLVLRIGQNHRLLASGHIHSEKAHRVAGAVENLLAVGRPVVEETAGVAELARVPAGAGDQVDRGFLLVGRWIVGESSAVRGESGLKKRYRRTDQRGFGAGFFVADARAKAVELLENVAEAGAVGRKRRHYSSLGIAKQLDRL